MQIKQITIAIAATLLFIAPLQAQTEEELNKDTDRILKIVEEMRGQKFKKEVPRKLADEAFLVKELEKVIEEEFATEAIQRKVQSLKMVGLLPKEMDLMGQYVEVMRDNVAGFYNPKNGTIYLMVREGDKMAKLMSDVIIAHELTHALDDQYYGLEKIRKSIPQDEDAQLAFTSAVEGSATVLMTRFMLKGMLKPGQALTQEDLQKAIEQDTQRAQSLIDSPRYFVCTLLPPYVNGMHLTLKGWSPLFMMANLDRGYTKEVRATLLNPPRSMEQVLHPNKYWLPQMWDEPIKVNDELAAAIFDEQGLKIVHADTYGEMLITALNWPETKEIDMMAVGKPNFWRSGSGTGWGGDRFYLLAPKDLKDPLKHPEKLKGMWITLWDTEKDRDEFMTKHAEHGPKIKGRGVAAVDKVGLFYTYGMDEAEIMKLIKGIKSEAVALLNKGEFHGDFNKTLSKYQIEKQLLDRKKKEQEEAKQLKSMKIKELQIKLKKQLAQAEHLRTQLKNNDKKYSETITALKELPKAFEGIEEPSEKDIQRFRKMHNALLNTLDTLSEQQNKLRGDSYSAKADIYMTQQEIRKLKFGKNTSDSIIRPIIQDFMDEFEILLSATQNIKN